MKAYVLPSGRRLYPFDDAAAEWRVLDRPLRDWQREVAAECGLTLTEVADREAIPPGTACVVLSDALYLEREALALFLQQARQGGCSVQAVAAAGPYAERILWHAARDAEGQVPLPLWYDAGDGGAARPLKLTLEEVNLELPIPAHMGTTPDRRGIELLLTRYAMVEIENWVNLYQANIQALMALTRRAQTLPWWRGLAAYMTGGGNLYGAMRRLSTIGKNCDIHPTAVIELSVIGDGARIGAHAIVRNCVVGAHAVIDDHAVVRATVVGAGASIANNNNVILSVVYPDAFLVSGPYQFSLFGRGCAIMHCICCDTRLDGRTVSAEIGPGQHVDTRQRYMGSCYGHGVRAGAGSITAPGRAIPNELFFLPPLDAVVSRIDADLPRRKSLFTEGGGLVFKGRNGARPPEVTLAIPSEQEQGV